MEIAVEKVSELTRKVTVTLPAKEVRKELDKSYSKLKKEVNLKGFRKGKVPISVLERNFASKVQPEVAETLVQATYFDAIEEEGMQPVVHPEIKETDFPEDGTFVYVAIVDVKPEIELEHYKGLEIEKPITRIEDEEVDARIEELRREKAVLQDAEDDHKIVQDDIATVDFQGFHNGTAMKEVHNEDYSVDVGTKSLGNEFEDKLLGMKKDESTLFETSFPGDFSNPVLAGKTVEFKIDVKGIKERIKPELNDEFAKAVAEAHTSLDDLRTALKTELKEKKEKALEGDLNDRIMRKMIDLNEFPIPERLVAFEIQEMIKQTEENLKNSNLTLESAGIKLEDLIKENRPIAEQRVRGDFLLKKVAELEDITIADADIDAGYQRIAAEYNMTLDQVKAYFKRREEIMPFIQELLNEKILNFLRSEAKIVEVEAVTDAPETTEKVIEKSSEEKA